ncbi:Fic family protein [Marinobacter sp.]|uniref:Fic family protein n=1 Tax=Marinobacter sp. TaxID=50741 RepID=UPI001A00D68F|nr:Fic family protein [Marinobacter sp.]MBE0487137.1 Fic family protein [Marinobacter sp.]
MYTWELKDWPHFRFDHTAADFWTQKALAASQRTLGAMSVVPEDLGSEARLDLLVSAAIETSAIEGEALNREDVRSSIKNHFLRPDEKVAVHDPVAAGISAVILEVMDLYGDTLTEQRLHHWNKLVLPEAGSSPFSDARTVAGQWRRHSDAMQIVSGPVHNPTVHFEAPPSARVPTEMKVFLDWFNNDSLQLPGVARAAIAHLWFETIHPYEDGNGRVGRAIADVAVSQMLEQPLMMSLATVLSKHRKVYYQQLNTASKETLDVTPWVNWFGERVVEALDGSIQVIQYVVKKARFWDSLNNRNLNDRQLKLIRKMLGHDAPGFEDGINAKKYQNLARCSKATATRDLQNLVAQGVLAPIQSKGRYARYQLTL